MRTHWAGIRAACFLSLFLVGVLGPASGRGGESPAEARIEKEKVEIGFGGKYKLGYWTEISVTFSEPISDPNATLEVTVWDGDGVPCTYRKETTDSPRSAADNLSRKTLLIKPGRPNSPLVITLRNKTEVLATRTFQLADISPPIATSRELYLTCFANDVELEKRISQPRDSTQKAVVVSAVSSAASPADQQSVWERLPVDPLAYNGVNGVLFNASGEFAHRATTTPQFAAILSRAGEGGKLAVMAMDKPEDLFTPTAKLPPVGDFAGRSTVRSTAALLRYAIPPDRLDLRDAFGEKTATWSVPKLSNPSGKIECAEGERALAIPLVVRRAHGFGEFVFVALDWDRPPLANAAGRGAFFDKLFRRTIRSGIKPADSSASVVAQTGYDDLSGQLRLSLDRFPGVSPFPFWSFVLLVAAYLAVIGPLDYYLVHRLFQRMQVAWLTLPLNILLFCGLTFVLTQYHKGATTHVHQVELVDVILRDDQGVPSEQSKEDVAQSRRLGWYQVFSPHAQRMTLVAGNGMGSSATATARLEWFGLPGGSLGGMNSASVASQESSDADSYSISSFPSRDASGSVSAPTKLSGYPIPVASSRPFTTHSTERTSAVARIQIRRAGEGRLSGTITNLHNEPLEDCVLFFERSYYNIGRLEPNKSFTLDDSRDPPDLASRLNRRRLIGEKVDVTPYDPLSTDVRHILETAMFFEAAGGRDYTHLQNYYLRDLDLSGQLELGRAALVGRTTQHGIDLLDAREWPVAHVARADDERVTLFRIMIPVEPTKQ